MLHRLITDQKEALPPLSLPKTGRKIRCREALLRNSACGARKIFQESGPECGEYTGQTSPAVSKDAATAGYLKKLRLQSLPQHEMELQVRECLQECERNIAHAVLNSPHSMREIISLGWKLQTNRISVSEINEIIAEETPPLVLEVYRNQVLTTIRRMQHAEQEKRLLQKKLARGQMCEFEKKALQKKIARCAREQIESLQEINPGKKFITAMVLKLKRCSRRLKKIEGRAEPAGQKFRAAGDTSPSAAVGLDQTMAVIEREEKRMHEARNMLVEAHLRLVVGWAKRYTHRGLDFLDLIQEGNIGLIKAASTFDPGKRYKFSTHATWWIKQTITRAIANHGNTIRIPVYLTDMMNKLARASHCLVRETGGTFTPEETENVFGLSPDKFRHLNYLRQFLSLDKPLGREGNGSLKDIIEDTKGVFPGDTIDNRTLYASMVEMMALLTPREKKVISLRFGIEDGSDRTLEKVGEDLSLSRQRIKQIEDRALSKLRKYSKRRGIQSFC